MEDDWCPYKKRKETQGGEGHVKTDTRGKRPREAGGGLEGHSGGAPRIGATTGAGEAGKAFPEPRERVWPC